MRCLSLVVLTALAVACGNTSETPPGTLPPPDPDCPATMKPGDICVDGNAGSDDDAIPGSAADPVKSITHALALVGKQGSGRTIYLMPARYDTANGEVFPVVIPAGITVRGTIPVAAIEIAPASATSADAAVLVSNGPILTMQGGAELAHVIALAQGSDNTNYRFVVDGGIAEVTLDHVYFHGGSAKVASFYVQGGTVRIKSSQLGPSMFLGPDKRLAASTSTLFGDGDDPIMLFGDVSLDNVTLRPERGAISLPGDVSAHGLTIESTSPMTGSVTIGPASTQLDVTGVAVKSSSLSIDTVVPQTLIDVSVTNGELDCSDCTWQTLHATGATVTGKRLVFQDSMLDATRINGYDKLKMRGCEIGAGSAIYVSALRTDLPQSAFDLGTQGSPGGNTFSGDPGSYSGEPAAFLVIRHGLTNTNVFAGGNTWLPNDSGADGTGHFASGTMISSSMSGKNLNKDSQSTVSF